MEPKLINKIYSIISGADNKNEYATKTAAIQEWLENGDLDGTETPESLAAEFVEYYSQDEE